MEGNLYREFIFMFVSQTIKHLLYTFDKENETNRTKQKKDQPKIKNI